MLENALRVVTIGRDVLEISPGGVVDYTQRLFLLLLFPGCLSLIYGPTTYNKSKCVLILYSSLTGFDKGPATQGQRIQQVERYERLAP